MLEVLQELAHFSLNLFKCKRITLSNIRNAIAICIYFKVSFSIFQSLFDLADIIPVEVVKVLQLLLSFIRNSLEVCLANRGSFLHLLLHFSHVGAQGSHFIGQEQDLFIKGIFVEVSWTPTAHFFH